MAPLSISFLYVYDYIEMDKSYAVGKELIL